MGGVFVSAVGVAGGLVDLLGFLRDAAGHLRVLAEFRGGDVLSDFYF